MMGTTCVTCSFYLELVDSIADEIQRELRHFTPWHKHRQVEQHSLPGMIRKITGQVGIFTASATIADVSRLWSRLGML